MNLLRAVEFKVGLLVIVVASLIGYMSMQVSEDPSYMGRSNEAWFQVPDAGGLVKGSAVKSAGIPVGIIKDIELSEEGFAKIKLALRPQFRVFQSSSAEIKSVGILGDKFVSINPGLKTDPPLSSGGQIFLVKDGGSLDSLVSQVGDIAGSLKDSAKALREAISEDGTRRHVLGRIVSNIEKLTGDIADITSENKEKVNDIVDSVLNITESLDEFLNEEGDDNIKLQIKKTINRLSSASKHIDEIVDKVNRGEGTIGRLINEDDTVEELNTAIEGLNNYLDTAGKTQAALDFHTDYLGNVGAAKTSLGVRLQPGPDRYYLLGFVDDPAGVVETTDTRLTTGGITTETNEVKTYHSKVKFNLLFNKNFYNFTIKGGLIENSGGLGFDYLFYHEKLKFTFEAFEFSKLNLRTQLQYNVWRGVYFTSGVSDILNRQNKYSVYIGGGLLLTNDDLKMMMSSLPLK